MSGIAGILGIADSSRVYANTVGQRVVYDAVTQLLSQYNADIAAQTRVFVAGTTPLVQERYRLPGGGRLQRLGSQAPSAGVKATGSWDVAYPLEGFGAAQGSNRVDYAYLTVDDVDIAVQTIVAQDINTRRYEMLKALLNNTARTFVDPIHGSLSIKSLANGDTVVYPPVLGSESEATDDHYLVSGYVTADISATNNPLITARNELEEHFGKPTGGGRVVSFINDAQTAKITALSEFHSVTDIAITPGGNTATVNTLPNVPGRILGRTDSGVWVSEWSWVPSGYMVNISLDAPAPLKMRVDPADTGLGSGLQLVAEDQLNPLRVAYWENRFGIGCANRLNGVVIQLKASGSYDIPSGYS